MERVLADLGQVSVQNKKNIQDHYSCISNHGEWLEDHRKFIEELEQEIDRISGEVDKLKSTFSIETVEQHRQDISNLLDILQHNLQTYKSNEIEDLKIQLHEIKERLSLPSGESR